MTTAMGVGDESGDASKRQCTSGLTEAPAHITTMDSASAVVEFKVNYDQAMHLAAGKAVHSEAFSAGGYMWRISFYPRGLGETEEPDKKSCEQFCICLVLLSNSRSVKAIFEVLLIDKDYRQPILVAALRNRQDIAPATFMYTDTLPGDDELGDTPTQMLEHLLAAADRYTLDRLKLLCAQKLWDTVSVDTVATTLACAEMYNCPELKQRCIGFFAMEKNFKRAVLTEGFVKLVQLFPSIILELRDGV